MDNARGVDVPADRHVDIDTEKQEQDVLHATDDLVDEELDVVVGKLLRLDDVVQVGPHQVGHLDMVDLVQKVKL